jgi:hypothetical protein
MSGFSGLDDGSFARRPKTTIIKGALGVMVTSTPLVDAQATAGNRQMVSAIIASVLGWSLDLFDLFALRYVTPVTSSHDSPQRRDICGI